MTGAFGQTRDSMRDFWIPKRPGKGVGDLRKAG